jgi:hypothetical protein
MADRIAHHAVYIPILRKEIFRYMENWNAHCIRKQRNRPNSVSGVPTLLYYWPEDSASKFGTAPDAETLKSLQRDLEVFGKCDSKHAIFNSDRTYIDPNEYLPSATLQWCMNSLLQGGFDVDSLTQERILPTGERAHFAAYKMLREELKHHINNQAEPTLGETVRPTGGMNWNPQSGLLNRDLVPSATVATAMAAGVEEMDIVNDKLN